ncbi:hypothetical protein JR316_0005448 [Psilocybe cubensis]|uniref:Uncharacterized protein n=2 Tax=Psilocybe cubensis TaxID=181762 RepID=A0ACB8H6S7_PSICU|nr:hypothetical protein JR316_0005448 [Psilocybe cubensis]KAH9483342.1 hypothetical protein JR316_0005448 [Psilocybe cubensis]
MLALTALRILVLGSLTWELTHHFQSFVVNAQSLPTATFPAETSTAPVPTGTTVAHYAQCGGLGWTGPVEHTSSKGHESEFQKNPLKKVQGATSRNVTSFPTYNHPFFVSTCFIQPLFQTMGATTKRFVRGYKLDREKIVTALDLDAQTNFGIYMDVAEVVYNRIRKVDSHVIMQSSLSESPGDEPYYIFVLDDANVKQVLLDKPLPPTPPVLDHFMYLLSGPVVCEIAG